MSLPEQTPRVDATLSTSTDSIPFAYPFSIDGELLVVSDARGVLALTNHYTVAGAGDASGGTVTMVGATAGERISIVRNTAKSQLLTLRTNGKFFVADIGEALDKITRILQETDEELARCLKSSLSDGTALVLPDAAARIGKLIRFDENGALTLTMELGNWRGEWVTAANYSKYDIFRVSSTASVFRALTAHTSDSIVADLASGDIAIIIDGSAILGAAGYAEEWANKAEDSPVSVAAGGDGSTEFSALHHAAKAAADVVLTNADVVLTGLDVVATNADVVATNADVVLTNADVVATNADVVATNADVVLTGIDAAASAASAAAAVAIPARQLNHKAFAGGVAFDGTSGKVSVRFPGCANDKSFSMVFESVSFNANNFFRNSLSVPYLRLARISGTTQFRFGSSEGDVTLVGTKDPAAGITIIVGYDAASSKIFMFENGVLAEEKTVSYTFSFPPSDLGLFFWTGYISGELGGVSAFNTALTATQAAEIYAQGVSGWLASNPDYKWGATGIEDFENGETASTAQALLNTSAFNGTHTNYDGAGDADSIGGAQAGDFCAKIVTTGNHGFQISSAGANAAYTFVCELWFYIKTGDPNFNVTNSFAMEIKPQTNFSGDVTAKDAWTKVSFKWKTGVGNPGNPLVRINNGTMYIDSMTITRIGASLHLPMDEGIGLQLHDASTNHNDAILSATGTQHLIPKDAGHIRGFGLDASSNDFVGSASVDLIPADCVIDSLQIIDQGGETSSGTIIQRSDGSNHNGLHSGVALAADGSISAATTAAQIANDQRLRTATSSGATNIDVRANFKKLNS